MSAIKNVTLVGAGGRLGTLVLDKLLASKKFNIRVLKRAGSSFTFASGSEVIEADFEDVESLKAAFQGQDAVVSTVGDAGIHSQKSMIDAAIAADVKRFLPSNFGSNMTNPNARKLPVFTRKVAIEDYLIEKSKTTALTYSFVYVGALTDFVIQNKVIMDVSNYAPKIFDGGESQFSSTSMSTVGDAVVGVLSHPEETRNRPVYVSEINFSQNQLFTLARQIAPSKPWSPIDVDLDEVVKSAIKRMSQGAHDLPTVLPIMIKSIVDPEYGSLFAENDNELLEVKIRGEEFLRGLITPLIN